MQVSASSESALTTSTSDSNTPLDRYLAELRFYLLEVVPADEAARFVEETEEHALALFEEHGDPLAEDESASAHVIEDLGDARLLADHFIEAWFGRADRLSTIEKRIGPANARALALFGTANLVFWVLLQTSVFLPSYSPLRLPWSPGEIRQFFPEPLPLPELTVRFFTMAVLPLLAPPILGWGVGRMVPISPHLAVYRVLTPIILVSYTIGVLLLPVTDGLLFAIVQLLYWLPLGCASAYLTRRTIRRKQADSVRKAVGLIDET